MIGDVIKSCRTKLGWTQEDLAGRIGVTPQTVSWWENGGYPDITMLPVLADLFGLTVDELMGIDAERFRRVSNEYRDATNRVAIRQASAHPVSEFLGTCIIVIVLWFGGTLIFSDHSPIA